MAVDREGPETSEKSELVYAPRSDVNSGNPSAKAALTAGGGIVGMFVVGSLASVPAGVVVLVAGIVAAVWRYRRAMRVTGVVLRLEHGELAVVDGDTGEVRTSTRLASLRDVVLESSTIQFVRKDDDESYILRAGGSDIDLSRLVLALEPPAESIALTELYVAHANCVEERGRIRAFLRRHGWVPADERPPDSTAA